MLRAFLLPTEDEALSEELQALSAAELATRCVEGGYEEVPVAELERYGFQGGHAEDAEAAARSLMAERGWEHRDEVHITSATPQAALDKFSPEHFHDDDEVRIVSAGEGVFDVRASNEAGAPYLRLILGARDWISIPPGRYHRFWCTGPMLCSAIRLFGENPQWAPIYRSEG